MMPDHVPTGALQAITEEFRRRKTHIARHGRQSLQQHLFNTFQVLTAWQQPDRTRYAGLVHSVYSADAFGDQRFEIDERDLVCTLVGEAAERLAYLYCVIDWRELLSVMHTSADEATETFEVSSRLGGSSVHLTTADAGDLLQIHMADTAEQSCQPDHSPASWLAKVSRLGRDARRVLEVAPPIFERCTAVVSKTEEAHLIADYQRLVARFGSLGEGANQLDQGIRARQRDWPFVAEPLVWMGFDAIAHGAPQDAATYGRAAAARLAEWGTPWDKRLSLVEWLQLCAALCDTSKSDELAFVAERVAAAAETYPPSPERLYIELARARLLTDPHRAGTQPSGSPTSPTLADADPSAPNSGATLPPRFQAYIAGLRTNDSKPPLSNYPGLRSTAWHDPQKFPIVRDLEAVADKIAAEARALPGLGFEDESVKVVQSGRWSYLLLYVRGRQHERNCALCPQTVAVIEANRDALTVGGIVYFSVLERDTQVAPHNGPHNMRVRCHLGLDVPENCAMRVDGTTRAWEEGRCLVFDDTFTHEVWNHGSRRRVVLVVDLWHPDLTEDELILLNGLQLPPAFL